MNGITFRTRYLAVSPQPKNYWNINRKIKKVLTCNYERK